MQHRRQPWWMPPEMRIMIATDAWVPQVNGVVRTYQQVFSELQALGHEVLFVTPADYKTLPCPTYPEIRLALVRARQISRVIETFAPDIVHIATEGPIGWATRRACLRAGRAFTTAYHTRFPEYIAERFPIPLSLLYKIVRLFHNAGHGTMVATRSLQKELAGRGFRQLLPWSRGVNTDIYRPRAVREFGSGPVALYVGRVAPEKNIEAFLSLDLNVTKVVVGDGPSLEMLKSGYGDVIFTGAREGEALASAYSSADVFVFPSRTDTFGIVMLEAMASGLPVAAFPVTGPVDVVEPGVTGFLDEDLKRAVSGALKLDRVRCRERAMDFSWRHCTELFLTHLKAAAAS